MYWNKFWSQGQGKILQEFLAKTNFTSSKKINHVYIFLLRELVYDRTHYIGLGPIPKTKMADIFKPIP